MATQLLLGPSVDNVTEPAPPAPVPTPALVLVTLAAPATTPGGKVSVVVDSDAIGVRPLRVYALFIPKGQEPVGDARTAEAFMAITAALKGSVEIPATYTTPPGPVSQFDINVAGVAPGIYFVQIVVEYPA